MTVAARTTVARTIRVAIAVALLAAVAAVANVRGANADVSIVGREFDPPTITIDQGDTVTWTVNESVGEPHSVTSGSPSDSGRIFDSGTAGQNNSFNLRDVGQTFQHTFEEPGEFPYYCVIHPGTMTGVVVVLAPGASPPAVEPPPSEVEPAIPVERRALAGGILVVSIALMFGLAWLWRRMNPA